MTVIRPGLCSVTYRQLTPEQIVPLAADAGLDVIEWGGDVHVPPGDPARAREVAAVTTDAGLAVASYGSYFRTGADEPFTPILDSAEGLGADRVRIWAGRVGSAEADASQYAEVADRLRLAADEASRRGITLALEYHRGTLADTPDATLKLLRDVGSGSLTTYWQPSVGVPDDVALDHYEALADRVSAVHVFSWWPSVERLPLRARRELWAAFFRTAAAQDSPPRDALLEFVPDDDPALLASEAQTLRTLMVTAS